jgi:uncharacterized protein with GYD domain
MAIYIQLYRWTAQGIRDVKASPGRIDTAFQAAEGMGMHLKGIYVTMGQYDLISVIEAPDDETVAKFTLTLGALGNVKTETLRAFDKDELRQLVAALP